MGDLGFTELAIEQVGHAQTTAVDLVGVGRTDATLGGTDLTLAQCRFAGGIEFLVKREYDVGAVGDNKLVGPDADTLLLDAGNLGDQTYRIDDNAVADDVDLFVPQDAGGQQVKDVFGALGDDGVAGVVATLSADYDVRAFGQIIDDLALAFIPPLEAGDDGVHEIVLRSSFFVLR